MILRWLYITVSLAMTLFCLPKALAQDAVGITVGGPTFIHFTHGLENATAVEAGVSFSYNHATHIYGDYLFETHDPLQKAQFNEVGLFYGVGGMIVVTNKDRAHDDAYYGDHDGEVGFGVRIPVGLDWRLAKIQKFSFHAQIVPTIAITPETELEFTAGIGVKFHF